MSITFLQSKTLKIGDKDVTLYDIGARRYLEYRQYTLDNPINVEAPGIDGELEVLRIYSRVVATSLHIERSDMDINELHLWVQDNFTYADILKMHEEISVLCGWNTGDEDDDERDTPSDTATPVESPSPKR